MGNNFKYESFTLQNNVSMPAIGIGTFRVKTYEEIYTLVDNALKNGYRLFDSAEVYRNESLLGRAFKELLPKYNLSREDIFVTTKLSPAANGYDSALKAIDMSLERLDMKYVDLYLIHFPGTARMPTDSPQLPALRVATWKAMEVIYKSGKAKAIGVSNFTIEHLKGLASPCSITPFVNQVEFHPYYKQDDLLNYCKSNGIVMQAYCSLGGTSIGSLDLMTHPKVCAIAEEHKATSVQVLLAWALQQGVAVIPKAVNPKHIAENININFKLTSSNMQILNNLDNTQKYAWDPKDVL